MSKLTEAVDAVARTILKEKQYLTELDGPVGDSDHGINMARGFEAVRDALADVRDPDDASDVLQAVGNALLDNVGGAAAPRRATRRCSTCSSPSTNASRRSTRTA